MSDIVSNAGYSGQELCFLTKETYCFNSGNALCTYDLTHGPREMIWRRNGIGCITSHVAKDRLAIASVLAGTAIELMQISNEESVCWLENPTNGEIISMSFSRDGSKLFAISGNTNQRFVCWSLSEGGALLFSEEVSMSVRHIRSNPNNENCVAFYGEEGLTVAVVNEISGAYSIRFQNVFIDPVLGEYENSEEERISATALSNSITFVTWLPFDFMCVGNLQKNLVEIKVDKGKGQVLRTHSLKALPNKTMKTYPTAGLIGQGTFIIATSTGSCYWFPMAGLSHSSIDKPLISVEEPLQISTGVGFISTLVMDVGCTKVITGTRLGGLLQAPADIQERVLDENAQIDLDASLDEIQNNEPILLVAENICQFQEGAVICTKSMLVPYDNKNSVSVFVTGSHSGALTVWKQPFVESEAIAGNTGVRRSVPRSSKQMLSVQCGLKDENTVICSVDVLPFRGKAGTCLLAVGTDSGWLEFWEFKATLSEEDDEEELGDDAVKISAYKVAQRKFYKTAINFTAATSYPSSVTVTNLVAFGSSLDNVVHVVEANNTANGIGFDVRCTFKVNNGCANGCEFEGAALHVSSDDGFVHTYATQTFAAGGPLVFPEPEGSFKVTNGSLSNFSILRAPPTDMTAIGFNAGDTCFTSVDLTSKDDIGSQGQHDSLLVSSTCSGNGRFVATGCVDGSVYLWSKHPQQLNKFTVVNRLQLHSDAVVSLCFSFDSSLLLSCGLDGSIFISTCAEAKTIKADTRAMKINDRSSTDPLFVDLAQLGTSRSWLEQKEEATLTLLKMEHTPDLDSISEALSKLQEKHTKLVEDNDARSLLEQMDHSEFVLDLVGRDRIIAGNEVAAEELRSSYNRLNMWNELTAARIRKACWDSMDQQSRPILPLLSEDVNHVQYSMSVRKYTQAEQDLLDKVRRMRCIEIRSQQVDGGVQTKLPGGKMRVSWPTSIQGAPETTSWIALDGARWPCEDVMQMLTDKEAQEAAELAASKKAPVELEDEDETIKAGVEEEEEDDDKPKETLDEGDIFNLLHAPQACRTQVQKRTQIILLKEVSRLIRSKFNTHFDKLVAAKEDVIGSIEAKNARITIILKELGVTETLFEPKWKIIELAGSAVTVYDDELVSPVFESERDRIKREALEEEARKREAEKDAENVQGRALMDMMNGVLNVKKDMLSEDALVRPAWMDEMDPKDMTELQLKELDEFDGKIRAIQEEQARYKKALETELKQLKQQSVDAIQSFDAKLVKMSKMKVLVQKELYAQELYVTRLSLSMAKRGQAWNLLKKNEESIDSTLAQRSKIRQKIEVFNVTVEEVKKNMNDALEEERNLDKGFNRNLGELTGVTFDVESLKVFKTLFRKKAFSSGEEEQNDLDAEDSIDDGGGTSKGSKSTSKGPKGGSKSNAGGASKKVSASNKAAAAGSKAGKENLGPMQEAAKALGNDGEGSLAATVDTNDPFYFVLIQQEKQKKSLESEIPLLQPLVMDADCPENFSVDQFTWTKLQELRTARLEKEIEAKVFQIEFNELRAKMDQLTAEDSVLTSCIGDLRDVRESIVQELAYYENNLEVIVCIKQGNDEIDQDAVISSYENGLLIPCSVVEKFNKKIKNHGKEKINVLTKIKQFRRKINIIDWNAKHLSMQAHHFEEYITDLQLLRVTRDLQQVIRDGSDESQARQRLEKISQRKEFLGKNAETKIRKLRAFNEGLSRNYKEKLAEMDKLSATLRDLQEDVSQRKSVQQSRNDARGVTGDASATATLKMKKVVQRRQLVDTARSQAEEIDYLRQELDKMRQRTFPSFAKVSKKAH